VITDIVRRDLPFYDATVTPEAVTRMIGFSQAAGILKRRPTYDEVVATQFRPLWTA
jgi:NitT/TauT family transport system substrate-binding protein